MVALAYSGDADRLEGFEQEMIGEGRYNRNMEQTMNTLLGRADAGAMAGVHAAADVVPPGRFQTLTVPSNMAIRAFVESTGAVFKAGCGFYQLTKPERVSEKKEVLLHEAASGAILPNAEARRLLGVGDGACALQPSMVPAGHTAYIQSTSYNRKLIGGTQFLYEATAGI